MSHIDHACSGAGSSIAAEVLPVHGFAVEPFDEIVEPFVRSVAAQGKGGAALAIWRDGTPVVDLTAGDYASDSLQLLFSVSKSLTALAAAHAHQHGGLDLDAPLADVWPEFARASTENITTRMVLSHRSGIASLDVDLSLDDLLQLRDDDAVARQEPYWEPDTAHGYHAFTFGSMLNGVFRRTLGVSVGQYLAQEIAGPNALELWIGTPDEVLARIQPITYRSPRVSESRVKFASQVDIPPSTTTRLSRIMDLYNAPEMYGADWPSISGVGSARGLAQLFALSLTEGAIISTESRRAMNRRLSEGRDRVLGIPIDFGSGMQRPFPAFPMLGGESFGHEGAGGCAAFADESSGIAVGFTTSVYPAVGGASPALLGLLPVIRHCLEAAQR